MKNYTITVNGNVYDVTVEEGFTGQSSQSKATVATSRAPEVKSEKASEVKPETAPKAGTEGAVKILAPMPGKILGIRVQDGQAVKRGDVLMILEAMKMENEIVAPQDGTIAGIAVAVGSAVEAGDTLASMN